MKFRHLEAGPATSSRGHRKGFPRRAEEWNAGNAGRELRAAQENRHFIQDYKLISKSLVLVNKVNEKQTKWTNLKMVWQLTGHKDAFLNYVRKEVRGYLSRL